MSISLALPPVVLSARAATRQWRTSGTRTLSHLAVDLLRRRHRERASSLPRSDNLASSSLIAPAGHAPHGPASTSSIAGPSRCFCTSVVPSKSSSTTSPAYVAAEAFESSNYDPRTAYFAPAPRAQPWPQPQLSFEDDDDAAAAEVPHRSLPAPTTDTRQYDKAFFTSALSTPRSDATYAKGTGKGMEKGKEEDKAAVRLANWSDQLDPGVLSAFLDQSRVLVQSGERSLSAIAHSFDPSGGCSALQLEELQCLVLRDCIARGTDADVVADLYRSSTVKVDEIVVSPRGMPHDLFRNLQRSTLERCYRVFLEAGLLRDAARLTGDPRLKPSQVRFLVDRLLFTLESPERRAGRAVRRTSMGSAPTDTTAVQREARLALQDASDSIRNWLDDGVRFKRPLLHRTVMLLCQARAYGHLLRLARSAQRRLQLDNDAASGQEMRTAGGFVRLRVERDTPAFLSQTSMEAAIYLLSSQFGDGPQTAYELLRMLSPADRSAAMYHHLMVHFGEVSILARAPDGSDGTLLETSPGKACDTVVAAERAVDRELWTDFCNSPHLGPATAHTVSCRMLSHAAHDNVALIREDLVFLHVSCSLTLLDLTEASQLAILSCLISHGDTTTGLRLARLLLSSLPPDVEEDPGRTRIFNALIAGAIEIRDVALRRGSIATDAALSEEEGRQRLKHKRLTRSQRLERFLRGLQDLQAKYDFKPDIKTIALLVKMLTRWDHVVDARRLYDVLEIVRGLEKGAASSPSPRKGGDKVTNKERTRRKDKDSLVVILRVLTKAFERRKESEGVRLVADMMCTDQKREA